MPVLKKREEKMGQVTLKLSKVLRSHLLENIFTLGEYLPKLGEYQIHFTECLNDMVQLSGTDSPDVAQISQFYNLSLFQELNHFQIISHQFLENSVEVFFFQMLAAKEGARKNSCVLITIKTESGCRL